MSRMYTAIVADLNPMRYRADDDGGSGMRRHDRASLRRLADRLDGIPITTGHRGRVVGRVDTAWQEPDGSIKAILDLEPAGVAAVAKGKRKLSLTYTAELHADGSDVTTIRATVPKSLALVRRARCKNAEIVLDLGALDHVDADDTDPRSRLAPPCRLAPGEDSRSCPIGSAGSNDGRLDLGDLLNTDDGRAIYLRAVAARYDAEQRGASVEDALAAYYKILDPAIDEMNERATRAEDTMATKKDCGCRGDHADGEHNDETRAAEAMRKRSIAESRGDQGLPSGDHEVDPYDTASRQAPDESKEARAAFAKRGGYNQGASRGRTREQALAALARDRERAPAGATQEAGRTDAAAATNPRFRDAVAEGGSVYDQINQGRGVTVNLALPKIEEEK